MEVESIQYKRNRVQDYLYLGRRIILPIFTMVLFAALIAKRVELIDTIVFDSITINIAGLEAFTYKAAKGIILFVILWVMYYRAVKGLARSFAENIKGDFPMLFYRIAKCLGYEKVSLVHKSIPLQFSILNSRIYKDYHTNESGVTIIEKENISYEREEIDGDATTINIGIFDSYDGDKSMLPNSVKMNKTVLLIPRKNDGDVKRFHSDVLINTLNAILKENNETKTFNLFLFTNPFTNKRIYENVFNTKSDNYSLKVYFFNDQENAFEDKCIMIKP